jgi:hypothetical protein
MIRGIVIGARAGQDLLNANNPIFIGTRAGNTGVGVDNSFSTISYTLDPGSPSFITGEDAVVANLADYAVMVVSDNGSSLEVDDLVLPSMIGETIVGEQSGASATITGTTQGSTSILIGAETYTDGYQDSIALGTNAHNTNNNQFMIGSDLFPINEIKVVQSGGTECIIDGSGLGCTSDERLKTNITDLSTEVLDQLTQVRTVSYNWKNNPNGRDMIGFLAQDLEQYFPQVVTTNENDQKSVYYSQMIPILTEAIRELDLKLSTIQTTANQVALDETFLGGLKTWLGDVSNGIGDLFAGTFHAKKQICIEDVCLDKSDFQNLLNQRIQEEVDEGYGYGYGSN